jgi:hypothetical protein
VPDDVRHRFVLLAGYISQLGHDVTGPWDGERAAALTMAWIKGGRE